MRIINETECLLCPLFNGHFKPIKYSDLYPCSHCSKKTHEEQPIETKLTLIN